MYKFVSTNSLIKPPRGSHVASDNMIQVLLDIKDIENFTLTDRRNQWDAQIDKILDKAVIVKYYLIL